jgi:hypothetical protein
MNIFQLDYPVRLREWKHLRDDLQEKSLEEKCVKIDKWWQQTPLVNHHLHWSDSENWPDPWTMLSENTYCNFTRALGICHTLLFCDVENIELIIAADEQCEDHNLVLVDDAKYILNYHPDTVLSNRINTFSIQRIIDISSIKNNRK